MLSSVERFFAERVQPDRLPADFTFPLQELRPGSRLPVAGTGYHVGRFTTLNNVPIITAPAMGQGLLGGEKCDLVQYLLSLAFVPKDSQQCAWRALGRRKRQSG
jgi:hypothetical protein